MTTAAILHQSTALSLVCLFVNDEAVVSDNSSNLVFLFLSTDAEHLVVNLDAHEILGKDIGIAEANLRCRLRSKIMYH